MIPNIEHYLPAILTAVLWGISYGSCEYALKTIDKKLFFFITGIITATFWSIYYFSTTVLHRSSFQFEIKGIFWLLFSISCGLMGNFFCIKAIEQMGSVKASIIEITYPFFCAVFIMICSRSFSLNFMQILFMILVFFGSAGFIWYDKK